MIYRVRTCSGGVVVGRESRAAYVNAHMLVMSVYPHRLAYGFPYGNLVLWRDAPPANPLG